MENLSKSKRDVMVTALEKHLEELQEQRDDLTDRINDLSEAIAELREIKTPPPATTPVQDLPF